MTEQTHLGSFPISHIARKAKMARPIATNGNVGTSLPEEAAKSLTVLATPNPNISCHPRCLPIRSIPAESLVNLRERHKREDR